MDTLKILLICLLCSQTVIDSGLNAQERKRSDHKKDLLSITVVCRNMPEIDSLFIYFSELSYNTTLDKENCKELQFVGNETFVYTGSKPFLRGQFVIRAKAPAGTSWAGRGRQIELTRPCYWEAGDSVTLSLAKKHPGNLTGKPEQDYVITFTGTGSKRYTTEYNIFQSYHTAISRSMSEATNLSDSIVLNIEIAAIEAALTCLESARDLLTDFYYQLFKADYIAKQYGIFSQLKRQYVDGLSRGNVPDKDVLDKALNNRLDSVADDIADAVKAKSRSYINYLYEKFFFRISLCDSIKASKDYVALIADRYNGPLRDRLLLNLILKDKGKQDINEIYSKASVIITDPDCLRVLRSVAPRLRGRQVLNFELPDITGRSVNLASLKGKVIFIDVWFSNCGACAAYYQNVLKQVENKLGYGQDISFVSISVDTNKDTWSRSVVSGKYTSSMAINLYTGGKGVSHEWLRYYSLGVFPTFVIIDKSGCVYHIYEDSSMDEIKSTDALLKTLKNVSNNSNPAHREQ